jgi:hypothetical protein
MKTLRLFVPIAILIAAVGCGGPEEPTAADHGGLFRVDSFTTTDSSTDVDTIAQKCPGGDLEISARTKKSGQAIMSNLAIGTNPAPSDIKVESYSITYTPLDGGTDLTPVDFPGQSNIIPGGGTGTVDVEMVPISTKEEFAQFLAPITQTSIQTTFRYQLDYQFEGHDELNILVKAKGSTVLTLGNFEICQ